MKPFISILFIIFSFHFAFSQDLHPLSISSGEKVYFDFGGVKMYTTGNLFTLDTTFNLRVLGGGGPLQIDSLRLFNKSFNSAMIELSLSRCVTSEYMEQEAGAFFVSIAFFDVDSNFVIGHSMISDYGFSLAGAAYDLQATKLISYELENNCYALIGKDELAIHQAFLYDPEETSGGVPKIHFVMIKVSSLGAG